MSDEKDLLIEKLQEQNRDLNEQVKKLVKTEISLYSFQTQLDTQMKLYRGLYSAGHKLSQLNIRSDVYPIVCEFIEYDLEIEYCIVLEKEGDQFKIVQTTGYYSEFDLPKSIELTEQVLKELLREKFIIKEFSAEESIPNISKIFNMVEYQVFPLEVSDNNIKSLIIAGNSSRGISYNTRIVNNSTFRVGLGNLINQINTTFVNLKYQKALEKEKHSLEGKVKERTKELQEANQQIVEQQNKLIKQEKFTVMGHITASMSHELSSPIVAINGASDWIVNALDSLTSILKKEGLWDELSLKYPKIKNRDLKIARKLEILNQSTDKVSNHINTMRSYIRLQSAKVELLDINKEIDITLRVINYMCPSNIEIETDYGSELNDIRGNAFEINQILTNLIKNAIESIPINAKGYIKIKSFVNEAGANSITIEDNGCGIPRDVREKLFREMGTTKENGTGIGLYLCRELMENNDIEVGIKSELGKGSTFILTFQAKGHE